ncbi:MAG TPA: hypothetical protein VIQ31_36745 [Phormidium sp.]
MSWNCCDDTVDIDYQTAVDDLPCLSEEHLFDSICQLCSDGWLNPDLAIDFFNTITFLSTFRIPSEVNYGLGLLE